MILISRSTCSLRHSCRIYSPANYIHLFMLYEIALIDILGTEGDTVADTVETSFEYELLLEKIQCLSERERTVLEMRFGLLNSNPLTQREVGKILGISRSYVSRIEKRAIEKLIEQSRDPAEEE